MDGRRVLGVTSVASLLIAAATWVTTRHVVGLPNQRANLLATGTHFTPSEAPLAATPPPTSPSAAPSIPASTVSPRAATTTTPSIGALPAHAASAEAVTRSTGDQHDDLAPAQRELLTTTVPVVSDPAGFQQPWGATVSGLLTFRGNPTRSFHGTGPIPPTATVQWRYPSRAMCGSSSEYGVVKTWCGTGWTGQPAVFQHRGRTWVVFGAYDYKIHFVDADTGLDIIPPFPTRDIAKGNVTIDPDGFPLVYAGSRDDKLRVIAFDRPEPTELWSLDAGDAGPTKWNDDWDAAPLVHNDYLIEGGENSRIHLVKLNRAYGPDGLVTVFPQLTWSAPGWDDELLRSIPDNRVSLESSVMLLGDTAYFASSGGLVQGWDVSVMRTGTGAPTRTFRFWTGDDTDATIVGDDAGFLYVGVEVDRNTARARAVGQLLKLDPRQPDQPVVWAVDVNKGVDSGTWSTPAVHGTTVVWPTKNGTIYGLDRSSGDIRWTVKVAAPVLSSPAVVDGVLIQGDGRGVLHAFDLGDGLTTPVERWSVQLDGNIESTPAVWKGRIYVGDRSGYVSAIGQG